MNGASEHHMILGEAKTSEAPPKRAGHRVTRTARAKALVPVRSAIRAMKATPGGDSLIARMPSFGRLDLYIPVASFTVCAKTGTATFLDIWDADHFDGLSDMKRCVAECRAWFSAEGYQSWDAPQTKTGRVNCFFKAQRAGNYSCTVVLRSFQGPAMVQCLIDSFDYGALPFNGLKIQPHPAALTAGYHSFRIRQLSGSYFFESLTVWRV